MARTGNRGRFLLDGIPGIALGVALSIGVLGLSESGADQAAPREDVKPAERGVRSATPGAAMKPKTPAKPEPNDLRDLLFDDTENRFDEIVTGWLNANKQCGVSADDTFLHIQKVLHALPPEATRIEVLEAMLTLTMDDLKRAHGLPEDSSDDDLFDRVESLLGPPGCDV